MGRFSQVDPLDRDRYTGYAYADDGPVLKADPSGREPVTICALIMLAYRTFAIGLAGGNAIVGCIYCRSCYNCIHRVEEYTKEARRYLTPDNYANWFNGALPGEECGYVCRQCGQRGIRALLSAVAAIFPSICRGCTNWWDKPAP